MQPCVDVQNGRECLTQNPPPTVWTIIMHDQFISVFSSHGSITPISKNHSYKKKPNRFVSGLEFPNACAMSLTPFLYGLQWVQLAGSVSFYNTQAHHASACMRLEIQWQQNKTKSIHEGCLLIFFYFFFLIIYSPPYSPFSWMFHPINIISFLV